MAGMKCPGSRPGLGQLYGLVVQKQHDTKSVYACFRSSYAALAACQQAGLTWPWPLLLSSHADDEHA